MVDNGLPSRCKRPNRVVATTIILKIDPLKVVYTKCLYAPSFSQCVTKKTQLIPFCKPWERPTFIFATFVRQKPLWNIKFLKFSCPWHEVSLLPSNWIDSHESVASYLTPHNLISLFQLLCLGTRRKCSHKIIMMSDESACGPRTNFQGDHSVCAGNLPSWDIICLSCIHSPDIL